MQVTFLGTNGWFDTKAGNTCSVLVQSEDYDIIFDAGNGIAKADSYITQKKPVFLFISHLHIDHIAGLHTLVKFRLKQGLHICTQRETIADLNAFVREPFTVPFSGLPYHSDIIGLDLGVQTTLPFNMDCLLLVHPVPCIGFRLDIDGMVITYCTDTGVCDNAITLASDADLLITECGLKPGESSPDWPHLNPQDAIGIAKRANAKRLALIHFGAGVYKTLEDRKAVQDQFEHLCPGLIVTTDDLTVDV